MSLVNRVSSAGGATETVAISQTTPGTTNGVVVNNTSASPVPVTIVTGTVGGASTYCADGGNGNALLTNSAVAVKASAGTLEGFVFVNTGASVAYVQIFDVASGSVTLGTTVPKLSFWVPAGGAYDYSLPISFATAITVAATTTTTGSTAPATGILANIYYK